MQNGRKTGLFSHLPYIFCLGPAYFKNGYPIPRQKFRQLGHKNAIIIQPIRPGEQRARRLELPYRRGKFSLAFNIGRIGQNTIEPPQRFGPSGLRPVALFHPHAA